MNVTFTLWRKRRLFPYPQHDFVGIEVNQFNPKFGVTLERHAENDGDAPGEAFRTFERTLLTNQTLEPTQVAGFNQFL